MSIYGISIETLERLRKVPNQDAETIRTLDWLINVHYQELKEPWIPLDEFLKSGFEGWCLVSIESYVILSERTNYAFFGTGGIMFDISSITHVMPIPKPEPPK